MERKHLNICLVSFFFHQAFFHPLSNMREIIGIISPQSNSIIVVSPELSVKKLFNFEKDKVIYYKNQLNPLFRVMNYFILNVKISWSILLKSKDVDLFLFFMETGLPLPMTIAKFRNKRIIWLLPSSSRNMTKYNHDFLDLFLLPLHSFSYHLADKIVVYSMNLIKEWKLQNYSDKILIAQQHIIHIDKFPAAIHLFDRPLQIGYIGRLSEEKGVKNFIHSLPAILNVRKDVSVLIGGEGPLKEEIESFLQAEKLTNRVNLAGWISEVDLPKYLNSLRLLVLPSYTEGLPNILLEAMICGTPVLATSVGAIPDIIKNGKTGYLIENNSSVCIAETIIQILEYPNLEKTAINSKKIIEKQFNLKHRVNQWNQILKEI